MANDQPSTRPTMTMATFIERAALACGGAEELSRLGFSTSSVEAMRNSNTPILGADAEALLEVFGLTMPVDAGAPA
jgi:hypothetical protein